VRNSPEQWLLDNLCCKKGKEAGLYPFKNRSDIALLASLSRGIFCRFLRYIKLALEGYIQQKVNSKAEKVETTTLPPLSSDQADQ
jgi:hypothetical protein